MAWFGLVGVCVFRSECVWGWSGCVLHFWLVGFWVRRFCQGGPVLCFGSCNGCLFFLVGGWFLCRLVFVACLFFCYFFLWWFSFFCCVVDAFWLVRLGVFCCVLVWGLGWSRGSSLFYGLLVPCLLVVVYVCVSWLCFKSVGKVVHILMGNLLDLLY